MLKQEVIAQGEEFKELAKDILPLVNQIEDILKKHHGEHDGRCDNGIPLF